MRHDKRKHMSQVYYYDYQQQRCYYYHHHHYARSLGRSSESSVASSRRTLAKSGIPEDIIDASAADLANVVLLLLGDGGAGLEGDGVMIEIVVARDGNRLLVKGGVDGADLSGGHLYDAGVEGQARRMLVADGAQLECCLLDEVGLGYDDTRKRTSSKRGGALGSKRGITYAERLLQLRLHTIELLRLGLNDRMRAELISFRGGRALSMARHSEGVSGAPKGLNGEALCLTKARHIQEVEGGLGNGEGRRCCCGGGHCHDGMSLSEWRPWGQAI